jgi:FSR family fosmidomycin resistance protein-like MFS transporter
LAGVAGALAGGWFSDRIGRRRVLAASMLFAPVAAILFLVSNEWFRFPLLLALGFALFSFGPVIMALVQEQFPENRALANGIYMSVSFLIRSTGIVAVGVIGDHLGLETAFAIGGIVMIFGTPFVFALPAHPSRQ